MPLTLGYYTRKDIPFYYSMADAFTICDQHFCSSLTGTTPNRLYLWTGTIRERPSADAHANVRNEDVDYGKWASWTTFPERLESHGVSWKIYQNELNLESGLSEQEDAWLSNFSDNPIEWFTQYHVRFAATHLAYRDKRIEEMPGEIEALEKQLKAHAGTAEQKTKLEKQHADLTATFKRFKEESVDWTAENFNKLSPRDKSLHARAFCTNTGDPAYRKLEEISYREGAEERRLQVPKGDVLHQFRKDVSEGKLPTVSWIVSPEALSDHPTSAWNGGWYVSEVLNILTHNPEVWKKTVFLLTYDENDGYFDHVPPFTAPHPHRPETGRVTPGIDTSIEYVELAQDRKYTSAGEAREGPIGLGYRVPLLIASPWSRGGNVCSQVFDHTSVLQFLEKLVTHKTGKPIEETNISRWRRAVCGDLASAFQTSSETNGGVKEYLVRNAFLEEIHRAKFKELPSGYHLLAKEEIEQIRRDPRASPHLARQEPGVRPSCALPYQLSVDGSLNDKRTHFTIAFRSPERSFRRPDRRELPFVVYALTGKGSLRSATSRLRPVNSWTTPGISMPLKAADTTCAPTAPTDSSASFRAEPTIRPIEIQFEYAKVKAAESALSGGILEFNCINRGTSAGSSVEIHDNAYKSDKLTHILSPSGQRTLIIVTHKSFGWYDCSVRVAGNDRFEKRYAGRVETGKNGFSDPAMGT